MIKLKMINFLRYSVLAFLCFAVGGTNALQAAVIDIDKIKPLSEVEFISEDAFAEQTKLITDKPNADDLLAYQVRLPSEWSDNSVRENVSTKENILNPTILGVVARYQSPAKNYMRSVFTVEAIDLTYEISARNWFINYILSNGLTLEQVGIKDDKQVEAILIEVGKDTTNIVRVKAIINGSKIVMARHSIPQEHYNDERVIQAQIIGSFDLSNPVDTNVEELDVYAFIDQSFFNYPKSWDLQTYSLRSIDRMKAALYSQTSADKLNGQVNIFLTNKMTDTSRSKEVAFYREKFQIDNYDMGKFIEEPKLNYHSDMSFGITQIYEMNPQRVDMIDYELWLSVLESDDYFYIISLLTPARDAEFYTWARNAEAYRLVVKSMRRYDENVDYFRFVPQ